MLGDYFDDSTSGGGSSSSDLISAIIGAGTALGTTAILASQSPQTLAQNSYIPAGGNAAPVVAAVNAQAKTSGLLWFGIFAIAGIVLYKAL